MIQNLIKYETVCCFKEISLELFLVFFLHILSVVLEYSYPSGFARGRTCHSYSPVAILSARLKGRDDQTIKVYLSTTLEEIRLILLPMLSQMKKKKHPEPPLEFAGIIFATYLYAK